MRMRWSKKRPPTLIEDLSLLLDDLCSEWGFCNQLTAVEVVDRDGIITAEDFAKSVLEAEGMDPEHEVKWFRQIKRVFTERYGNSVSLQDYGALFSREDVADKLDEAE